MSSEKRNSTSKVKRSAKALTTQKTEPAKNLKQSKVSPRSKMPELSVVNVIEQISKILRTEVRDLERKKASGE